MSVINDMLRDLQARENRTGRAQPKIHNAQPVIPPRRVWPWGVGAAAAAAALLLSLATGNAVQLLHGLSRPAMAITHDALLPSPATTPPTPRIALAPDEHPPARAPGDALPPIEVEPGTGQNNVLGSIRVGVEKQRTRVVFKFTRELPETNLLTGADGSITLTLHDVDSVAAKPALPHQNAVLDRIEIATVDGTTEVRLVPRTANVHMKRHTVEDDGEFRHWLVIDMRAATNQTDAAATAVPTAPQPEPEPESVAAQTEESGQMNKAPRLSPQQLKARELRQRAARAEKDSRISDALHLYLQVLELAADDVTVSRRIASLYLRQGAASSAERFLRDALDRLPDANVLRLDLARTIAATGRINEALDVMREQRPEPDTGGEHHALSATLHQQLGQHHEAVIGYQAALRRQPQTALWWMGLAISLESLGHNAQALTAFQNARRGTGLRPDLARFVTRRIQQLQAHAQG